MDAKHDQPFQHLSQSQLSELYTNFVHYRDAMCDGAADMNVVEFNRRYGVGPHPALAATGKA
jgi:hypothetical protein